MTVSVHEDLTLTRRNGHLGFRTTEEEALLIRKAAELEGWTVSQYILCAVLDRAERDLYTAAAVRAAQEEADPVTSAEPFTSLFGVLGERR